MDANAYPLIVLPPEHGSLVPVSAATVDPEVQEEPLADLRVVLFWLWRRFCKLAVLFFLLWIVCRHLWRQLIALRQQVIELRQQANFWKAQHQRAVQREAQCKEKIELLQGELRELKRRVYGQKSETSSTQSPTNPNQNNDNQTKRKRGQQRGSRGHGRRHHDHLPTTDEICDLPDTQKACCQCGEPLEEISGTADGDILEIDVRAHRRRYHRKRYRCRCGCANRPAVVTAPPPDKLIPKSNLGLSVWAFILQHKFQFFQPLHRTLAELRGHSLNLAAGTITDGLQKLVPLFEPIYAGLIEHNRDQEHWHCDETRWLVFEKRADKVGFAWMLWVFAAKKSIAFVLDPTRSHDVPETHFGANAEGIANVDRYSAYKAMAQVKADKIVLAFCWAHVRRDFLAILTGWSDLNDWAWSWVEDIGLLYHRNDQRLAVLEDADQFSEADQQVRAQVEHMRQRCETELAQPTLRPPQRKALTSLQEHWTGLTVFVDHPEVPMDNNTAERCQRGPVVARKNFYGSGALWSGRLAAMLFSLFQTMPLWGLDVGKWLTAYLAACAKAGGKPPPNPHRYLPWKMPPEEREPLRPDPAKPRALDPSTP